MNKEAAYEVGVRLALHDAGMEKTAISPRFARGLMESGPGLALAGAGMGAAAGSMAGGDLESALQGALIGGGAGAGALGGLRTVAKSISPSKLTPTHVGRGALGGLAGGLGMGGLAAHAIEDDSKKRR